MNTEELEQLKQQLPGLKQELKELHRRKAELDTHVSYIESIVRGIEGLVGPQMRTDTSLPGLESKSAPENGSLTGIAAVRRIIEEDERVWGPGELHEALEERGWIAETTKHPRQAIEAAIHRLWKGGKIERVARGKYRRIEGEAPLK